MKNLLKNFLLMGMIVGCAQWAHAVPTLRLSSGAAANTVTLTDNTAGDTDATAGIITRSGAVGTSGWSVNVTTGKAQGSAAIPDFFLGGNDFSGPTATSPLLIEFSADNYGPSALSYFASSISGTTQGNVQFRVWADAANALFGHGTLIYDSGVLLPSVGSAFGASGNGIGLVAALYSMTVEVRITHPIITGGMKMTSFSADVEARVPDHGATFWLLLSSFAVLGLLARSLKLSLARVV